MTSAMLATELAALFTRDLTRLAQQLRAFPDEASLWQTPPGVVNAAGNLALHLEGNLREYVGRQLGQLPYQRQRPLEFSRRDVPAAELAARVDELRTLIPSVVGALPAATLDAPFPEAVFGAPLSSRQFLIHLLGHLNYHLGQMDYVRRVVTGAGAITLAEL
jgi:hypothetical protein